MWLFGHATELAGSIGLFALMLTILACRERAWTTGHARRRFLVLFLAFALGIGVLSLAVLGLKRFTDRARPIRHFAGRTEVALHIHPSYRLQSDSFPSGHTARAFCLAIVLATLLGRNRPGGARLAVTSTLVAWAAWMGYARIYLAVHFPGDVMAGALLGSLFGLATVKAVDRYRPDLLAPPVAIDSRGAPPAANPPATPRGSNAPSDLEDG